jgi:hypothetical protein
MARAMASVEREIGPIKILVDAISSDVARGAFASVLKVAGI